MPAQDQHESTIAGIIRVEQNAYRRCFSVGAIFAVKVASFTTAFLSVSIPAGTSLTITTANSNNEGDDDTATLYIIDEEEQLMPLCCIQKGSTVAGLGLTWVGPQDIQLKASGGNVNLFGSVAPAMYEYKNLSIIEDIEQHIENDSLLETNVSSKKRKMSESESQQEIRPIVNEEESNKVAKGLEVTASHSSNYEEDQDSSQLSKKQRRKLAKQKAKELAEAVALLNKHEVKGKKQPLEENKTVTKKVPLLAKERRLPSGVLVKDLIIGMGPTVQLGRNVSILYEGAFPTGKVFDKNKNRNKPLTFRLGTGEVIRGLEKGLEGMKVGGEREITIPPELGYGKKGSSNVVPPNSTLVFSVQLVGLGG
jgi:FKBP-type peptidyl-prolyl cis-trans isomerase